ncbi:MAG: hypothetical protein C0609_00175 [Deltaproteobacteria bacterium]|nr:MAG: hypothetical protein C0609_00175 [Deltaproteobacteria bacterium]
MGIVEEKASAAPTRVTIKSGVAVKVNAPRPTTTRTVSVKTISMKEITKPQSGDGKISSEEGKTPSIVHTPPETASRVGDRVILKMVDTKFDNANENDALSALSLCLELADRIRASDFSPDVELRRLTASIRAHVMALLNEESAIVSAKAAEVAGAIHDETSMPILANLLESPSALVREKAYDALKEISGKTFPPSAKKWQEYIKSEGSTSME